MTRKGQKIATRIRWILGITIATTALAGGTLVSASAAEPSPIPPAQISGIDAGTVQHRDATILTDTGEAAICQAFGRVDSAHISSSSGNLAIQSHGGWINVNCNATHANITVGVMKKNVIGIFVDVGRLGKKTMAANAWGSGKWAVAHYDCKSRATHSFQSWVDVDMIGITDFFNKTFSLPVDKGCN